MSDSVTGSPEARLSDLILDKCFGSMPSYRMKANEIAQYTYPIIQREAIAKFIEKELPLLIAEATADYGDTYDGWVPELEGMSVTAKIAKLRSP